MSVPAPGLTYRAQTALDDPRVAACNPRTLTLNGRRRIYRILCWLAHSDGDVHPRERVVLHGYRLRLGLDPLDAELMERDVVARYHAPPPRPAAPRAPAVPPAPTAKGETASWGQPWRSGAGGGGGRGPRHAARLGPAPQVHRIQSNGLTLLVGWSPAERDLLVRAMLGLIAADGVLDPAELVRLQSAARALGIPERDLQRRISEHFA